jgi:hypothetical protein
MFEFHRRRMLALLGLTLICAAPACAGLGGDAAGVLADAGDAQASITITASAQYEIRECESAAGVRIREFLNGRGTVFAVAWAGPVLPDMQRLLGASFATYAEYLSTLQHAGLHRSVRIATSNLVLESGGHLRAFAGRAYLPDLVPQGTPLSELR